MNPFYRIIPLFFSTCTLQIFAQTTSVDSSSHFTNHKFNLGVLGGPNFFYFKDAEPYQSVKFKTGTSIGLAFQYNFNNHSSVTTNLLLENKKYDIYSYGTDDYKLKSITVPIMYKYSTGKTVSFNFNAGAFLSFQYKTIIKNAYYNGPSPAGSLISGLVAGIGTRIPLAKNVALIVEARDYYGGTVTKSLVKTPASNTANLLVGLNFGFGKSAGTYKENKTAQDSTYKKERKVFIKPFYAAQITYRNKSLQGNTHFLILDAGNSQTYCTYDSKQEKAEYGYEAGLLLEFKLSHHFNINTGMSIEDQGFKTGLTDVLISGWGDLLGYFSHTSKEQISYRFQFLSLPLILNYEVKKGNYSFYLGTGAEAKLLLNSSIKFTDENGYSPDAYNSSYSFGDVIYSGNRIALFYSANVGVSRFITKKTALFIEPDLKYQIGNLEIPNQHLNVDLLSAGCRVGVKF